MAIGSRSVRRRPALLVELLREVREDAGLTQAQLAERLPGFGMNKLSRIESGLQPATVGDTEAIARALGLRLEWHLTPVSRETDIPRIRTLSVSRETRSMVQERRERDTG